MEHRWGQRREVNESVRLRTLGGLVAAGHLRSASISGAFIATPLPVSVLSYVQVLIVAERRLRKAGGVIEGQVVRRTPEGLAIEWCELAPEAVRMLLAAPSPLTRADSEPAALAQWVR